MEKSTAGTEYLVRAISLTIVQYSFESWSDGSVFVAADELRQEPAAVTDERLTLDRTLFEHLWSGNMSLNGEYFCGPSVAD